MSGPNQHSNTLYYVIFAILLGALGVSLGLTEVFGNNSLVVATIFAIATVKAILVVGGFMHLWREPRYLKILMGGTVLLLLVIFVGLRPDIRGRFGRMAPRPANAAVTTVAELKPADAARGEKVYTTYCQACHQPDGRGNGGTTAANFVDDHERMAQADEVLLHSIREGKQGKIGAMPPWGSVLSPQQQVDVLKYVRTHFAGQP